VGTLIHYPVPPHLSKAYAELGLTKGAFPITEAMASSELSLPMGPHLSLEETEYVVDMIREYMS
jgi:dTDP-4-amino-4,6-dideoxygalactose transaminase